jgi:DNA-binding beta-propeller fold protein YncE
MLRYLFIIALSVGMFSYAFTSCTHEDYDVTKGNFPAEISSIMVRKCATEGCHDAAGGVNAARLRLDTWDELFKGSSRGAVVVPYSTKYSILLYYINQAAHGNTDIVAAPSMPYNSPALTKEEYNTVKNWIANGAPDAAGNIAFASNPDTRQKIYMTQQVCEDLVTVVDGQSGLIMRYIPVGINNNTEVAHNVKVSKDGRYAYVCFTAGTAIQKIDTRTDAVVGTVDIGPGSWNVLQVSPDGNKIVASDMANAAIKIIDANSMTVIDTYGGIFTNAHGIAYTSTFDTLYITGQYGNVIYRFSLNTGLETFTVDGKEEMTGSDSSNTPDPHEILMSPDYSKYFVTCMTTGYVRVLDVDSNRILAAIKVGAKPLEMVISPKRNLIYVTCQEDGNNNFTDKSRGSVYVIDMSTYQVTNIIYGDFFQPHGITIDDKADRLYIVSRNYSPDGPAPHHSAVCNGRNGWYKIYDLNTLKPYTNIRYEVTPDPYSADVRFK